MNLVESWRQLRNCLIGTTGMATANTGIYSNSVAQHITTRRYSTSDTSTQRDQSAS
jgi:hypothetical protein